MVNLYPYLVEVAVEFKRYSRKFLADLKGERYEEAESARKIALAKGFKLVYGEITDKYYCLTEGQ